VPRVVATRPDGSAGVRVDVAIGGRFPHLLWIGLGTLGGGLVLVLLGVGASTPPDRSAALGRRSRTRGSRGRH